MIRNLNRSHIAISIGVALFVVALLFGFLWAPLQRSMYEAAFHAATGARLHVSSIIRNGAETTLDHPSISAADGDAVFTADRVAITRAASGASVEVDRPSGNVTLGRDTLRRMKGLLRGIAFLAGGTNFTTTVRGGSLQLERAPAAGVEPLRIDNLNVTAVVTDGVLDIQGRAIAGTARMHSPLTFTAGHARIARLPLAALAALLPPSGVALTAGIAHDVDFAWIGGMSGTAGISGVRGTYGTHAIDGMHGALLFSNDGLATRALLGNVDGVPVTVAGELHDVRNWSDALRSGTPALRSLAKAYEAIAPTPHLHYIHLEATAPGVTYAQYAMLLDDAPRVVQFVIVDPREKSLHFDTALSGDHLISKGERTTDMGIRTHAVAGINGDYFDIGATYQPQGMFMKDGRLLRGPVDREALIVDRRNNVYFSEFHLNGTLTIGSRALRVTQYNSWPLGYVTIVTPDFGSELPAVAGMRFLSLHYLRRDRYRVTSVTLDRVPSPVPFGVAIGPDVKHLKLPKPGDVVRLNYAIDPHVRGAVAGVGGGPLLLRNGEWFEDPNAPAPDERDVRWPVDALGIMQDRSLILVAVDGRHPERSVGMTRPEFGKLLQQLGVTDAMALDSGGSVTLVARSPGDAAVSLHNVPSDDSAERYVSNGLFIYSTAPAGSLLQNRTTASAASSN